MFRSKVVLPSREWCCEHRRANDSCSLVQSLLSRTHKKANFTLVTNRTLSFAEMCCAVTRTAIFLVCTETTSTSTVFNPLTFQHFKPFNTATKERTNEHPTLPHSRHLRERTTTRTTERQNERGSRTNQPTKINNAINQPSLQPTNQRTIQPTNQPTTNQRCFHPTQTNTTTNPQCNQQTNNALNQPTNNNATQRNRQCFQRTMLSTNNAFNQQCFQPTNNATQRTNELRCCRCAVVVNALSLTHPPTAQSQSTPTPTPRRPLSTKSVSALPTSYFLLFISILLHAFSAFHSAGFWEAKVEKAATLTK